MLHSCDNLLLIKCHNLEGKQKRIFGLYVSHIVWIWCWIWNIGKLPRVKRVVGRGKLLVGFIYNHSLALNTMRKSTNKMELVRNGMTMFAITFLVFQRLHKKKTIEGWSHWRSVRTQRQLKSARVYDIVLVASVWNDVFYSLKTMRSIVQVLRLANNKKSWSWVT